MKSTFKKLLSLMLVAMLLVSAIPFAASADTTESQPASSEQTFTVRYVVTVDGGAEQTKDIKTVTSDNYLTVLNDNQPTASELAAVFGYTSTDYNFGSVKSSASTTSGVLVYSLALTKKSADTTSIDSTTKVDKIAENTYKVYLRIYTNNNIASATKIVDITDGYAVDNYVSWSEVEQYVKNNFNASNSLGTTIDGIYVYEGSYAANWLNADYKQTNVSIPSSGYRTGDINLMVMLTGKSGGTISLKSSSSSSTTTSSNPKTGDTIGMSVLALGVSASALAAAYYVEKKRLAR